RLATVYIETIRNIPLLLQLFFWYFAVLKAMPAVRESLALPFGIFIKQRGLMLPRPTPDQEFTGVMVTFGLAVIVAIALSVWALRPRALTGRCPRQIVLAGQAADACTPFLIAFAARLVLLAVLFPLSNAPMPAAIL